MTIDPRGGDIPDEVAKRFRALSPRPSGQTGFLFDGNDASNGKPVVVKVLRDEAIPSPGERQRIIRELQKLSTVKHAGLAEIVGHGDSGGRIWVARARIEGTSLADKIAQSGSISPPDAARIAAQIAAALGELHRFGVLHRDVRPSHVILEPNGNIKLLDAAVGRSYRTPDGRMATGTPGYVAPESIAGKLVSFRSDLYSLGATLYEMLVGTAPYVGGDANTILRAQGASDPQPVRVAAPPALVKLVASLMSREPRERPFSAQQLERQLEPLASKPKVQDDAMDRTMIAESAEDASEATMMVSEGELKPIATPPSSSSGGEFDEGPTHVGESPLHAVGYEAKQIPAAGKPALPTRAPPPPPASALGPSRTQSSGNMAAISKNPLPSRPLTSAPANRPPPPVARAHKPTLMGFSASELSNPNAGAVVASSRTATPLPSDENSGRVVSPPRDDSGDFDEPVDTVVTEDSRIFGIPEVTGGSPHGTAVPPLPDDVAERVLTGSIRPPSPGLGPNSHDESIDELSADSTAIVSEEDAFSSTVVASSDDEIAAQASGADRYDDSVDAKSDAFERTIIADPDEPRAPLPAYGAAASSPPYGQQHPSAGYAPGYAAPVYQQQHGYADQSYGHQGYRGAASIPVVASRPSIIPWLLAGIAVAAIAGTSGYFVAIHTRPAPIVIPPPSVPAPMPPPPTHAVHQVIHPLPATQPTTTPPTTNAHAPVANGQAHGHAAANTTTTNTADAGSAHPASNGNAHATNGHPASHSSTAHSNSSHGSSNNNSHTNSRSSSHSNSGHTTTSNNNNSGHAGTVRR